jgi:hypothetical protein
MKKPLSIAAGLVLLALLLGGLGLVLRAARWLLIIAALVLVVGALTGFVGGSRRTD